MSTLDQQRQDPGNPPPVYKSGGGWFLWIGGGLLGGFALMILDFGEVGGAYTTWSESMAFSQSGFSLTNGQALHHGSIVLLGVLIFFFCGILYGRFEGVRTRVDPLIQFFKDPPPPPAPEPEKDPTDFNLGYAYTRLWDERAARHTYTLTDTLVSIPKKILGYHLAILAQTRSGKTYSIMRPLVAWAWRVAAAAICFDPKGDDFNDCKFHAIFSLVPADLSKSVRLCLIDDKLSINDAAGLLAESLLVYQSNVTPFFVDNSREAMKGYLTAIKTMTGQWPELSDFLDYLSDPEGVDKTLNEINDFIEKYHDARPADCQRLHEATYRVKKAVLLGQSKNNDVLNDLYTVCIKLGTGEFRNSVTLNSDRGLTVRRMLEEKMIVRISFTAQQGDIGNFITRVVINNYVTVCLAPPDDPAFKTYPKLLLCDELHNYITADLGKLLSQGAGNGAVMIGAMQNSQQFADPNLRDIVLGSPHTVAVMGNGSPIDNQAFADRWGKEDFNYISTSTGKSVGRSAGAGEATHKSTNSGASTSLNTGESQGYRERYKWTPMEIKKVPEYHAIIESRGVLPEPILVRFLTSEERILVDPPVENTNEVVFPDKLYMRNPLPYTYIRTKKIKDTQDSAGEEDKVDQSAQIVQAPQLEKTERKGPLPWQAGHPRPMPRPRPGFTPDTSEIKAVEDDEEEDE